MLYLLYQDDDLYFKIKKPRASGDSKKKSKSIILASLKMAIKKSSCLAPLDSVVNMLFNYRCSPDCS